jgi:hypothetical protein
VACTDGVWRILRTVIARLRRLNALLPLSETAVLVVLPATIFAVAMGSSSVGWAVRVGSPLRWLMLFALVACAVPYGLSQLRFLPRTFLVVIASLVGVALLSASWSVTPKVSGERAISFFVLMFAVVFVGSGASRSRGRAERLFASLLIAADLVGLAGLVVLAVDHNLAVQAGVPTMSARMRGFGENPDTASMLFALALPIAEWLFFAGRGVLVRLAAGASFALLYGSIIASGSRGALMAATAGSVVFFALLAGSVRRLVVFEVIVVAFFAGSFQISGSRPSDFPSPALPVSTKPAPVLVPPSKQGPAILKPATEPPPSSPFEVGIKQGLTRAEVPIPFVPRSSEIGHPSTYDYKPIIGYGSGRVLAWLWAIRQGLDVPVLGYGFGTESTVFVDRFYVFEGSYTENSFIGMFLQLGAVGTVLLLLPFLLVGSAVLRARREYDAADRRVLGVAAGIVAGGFAVAFVQSYLYSVGNIATLTFWVGAILAIIVAAKPRGRAGRD